MSTMLWSAAEETALTPLTLAFLLGIGQGLLHGLGPDHCAAVATLGMRKDAKHAAFWTAVQFAIGHAVSLALLSSVSLAAGLVFSEGFEQHAEIFGGAVLVVLALTALFFPGALEHGHSHLPGHDRHHRHARLTTAAGALLAVSGARALILSLAPLLVAGGLSTRGLAYLPGFALGILVSMGAVGLLLSMGVARLGAMALQRTQRVAAAFSAVLGVVWIAKHL